jgi:hypothetical protein
VEVAGFGIEGNHPNKIEKGGVLKLKNCLAKIYYIFKGLKCKLNMATSKSSVIILPTNLSD